MATNVSKLYQLLNADATLVGTLGPNGYSGILQGGLWDRPLKREGAARTEAAFYGESVAAMQVRPSAVILDGGDVPHSQRLAVPQAYVQYIYIYFYAPPTSTGKTKMAEAQKRILVLLDNLWFATDDGTMAEVRYINRRGVIESEGFPGVLEDYCRYQIVSRYSNAI
jgi:hypothetical protein